MLDAPQGSSSFDTLTIDWSSNTYAFSTRVRNIKGWSSWSENTAAVSPAFSSFSAEVSTPTRQCLMHSQLE